jgi:mTERF
VLGYSVERELKPKWEYLARVCLYPSFELSAFPAYFSYPLDRVIKTRYEYLQFVKKSPTQLLALDLVVRYGDKDFAERVAKDTDGGVAFSKFSKLRRAARNEQSARKATEKKESRTLNRSQTRA